MIDGRPPYKSKKTDMEKTRSEIITAFMDSLKEDALLKMMDVTLRDISDAAARCRGSSMKLHMALLRFVKRLGKERPGLFSSP